MGLNEIAAFWLAYTLTRPIGASFADRADKPLQFGGLDLGSGFRPSRWSFRSSGYWAF